MPMSLGKRANNKNKTNYNEHFNWSTGLRWPKILAWSFYTYQRIYFWYFKIISNNICLKKNSRQRLYLINNFFIECHKIKIPYKNRPLLSKTVQLRNCCFLHSSVLFTTFVSYTFAVARVGYGFLLFFVAAVRRFFVLIAPSEYSQDNHVDKHQTSK